MNVAESGASQTLSYMYTNEGDGELATGATYTREREAQRSATQLESAVYSTGEILPSREVYSLGR